MKQITTKKKEIKVVECGACRELAALEQPITFRRTHTRLGTTKLMEGYMLSCCGYLIPKLLNPDGK